MAKDGEKKSIFKRWWFWLIVVIVIIAIAGSGTSGSNSNSSSSTAASNSTDAVQTDNGSSESTGATDNEEDSGNINAEKFAAIEQGMSYEEVVDIIGSEGVEQSTSTVGDITTTIYDWDSDSWGNASVTFQNDKVVNKTQIGVSGQSEAEITMDMYNQIETGMTYDEVVAIIGGEGELQSDTSVAGISSQLYSWPGSSLGSSCSITFNDGKVSSKSQYGLD